MGIILVKSADCLNAMEQIPQHPFSLIYELPVFRAFFVDVCAFVEEGWFVEKVEFSALSIR